MRPFNARARTSASLAGVSVVTIAAVTALVLPSAVATADVDAPPSMTPISSSPAAEAALDEAIAVMAGESDALSPTMALRNLALRASNLTGSDRADAEQLLMRPNGGRIRSDPPFGVWNRAEAQASKDGLGCSADPATPVCVHWTNRGRHAPRQADTDTNGVPNWVEITLAEMEYVWTYETQTLGYREPLTDQRGSIDNDGTYFDVYLSDLGSKGYYGYCTLDDSRLRTPYGYNDFSGYCVVDNDFASSQFPHHTPRENLQVTAAHEFFHAIQFGYDTFEDIWFMEGSAAWIEDEVFDEVNDNRQYLRLSQFKNPFRPIDHRRGLAVYGGWGFLRYLSDRFDPAVIKTAWQRADGSRNAPNDYSLQALRRAVQRDGASFTDVLGDFGIVLNEPQVFINEHPPFPSVSVAKVRLSNNSDSTKWRGYELDHLSYAPITFRPGDRVGSNARLRITVDGPAPGAHPEVRAMVVKRGGGHGPIQRVHLNRSGRGSIGLDFAPQQVARVVLSLGNASDDFRRCYRRITPYSCHGGIPVDDGKRFWYRAAVN